MASSSSLHTASHPADQQRIVVGLSGGVDSAVSAWLLQQQGYDVQAVFMKNWEEDDREDYCSATADLEDAGKVCDRLGITLHTRNFAAEYWDNVFSHFLAEYSAGRTPNPDVLCNREIKFKTFIDHAQMLGASRIATGHYARVQYSDHHFRLLKGVDPDKDQSYFLHALNQEQLSRAIFPLGEYHKPQVRKIAAQIGLANHAKKDSTGICFIGEQRFKDFLSRFLPAQPGDMQTPDGQLIGQHDGLMYYTLGQRQGLGIGGRREASEQPWYVVGKDMANNILVVAQGHDHPLLFHNHLLANQLTWITTPPATLPWRCSAKIRYRQADQSCIITQLDDGQCRVEFDQPQRAITPGQSVVFYQGDECLGGGVIT